MGKLDWVGTIQIKKINIETLAKMPVKIKRSGPKVKT